MNQLSLIKPEVCPPDGFRYVDPIDGFTAHSWDYRSWLDLQIAHLRANKREIPLDLAQQMELQLCQTLPPDWCNYDDPLRPRVSASLDWGDVLSGLKTFGSWVTGGCNYVDQPEADRRALICSRCYLNVNVQGCASCHKAVEEIVRNKHSKYDFALRGCAVCKCFLRAKIHFPIATLDKSPAQQELYPDFCWLKKTGENYRG